MSEVSPHAHKRLSEDLVVWMTTVSDAGRPSTAPVWFLYDGETVLVYSRDPSVRVSNLEASPHVTLALNSDPLGHDVVVVNGRAVIDAEAPSVPNNAPYVAKYREQMDSHDWSAEWFDRNYPTAIRIAITSVSGR